MTVALEASVRCQMSTCLLNMLVHVRSGEGEQHAECNRQREHCRRGDSRMFPSQRPPAGDKQTDQGRPNGVNVVTECAVDD